jgi:PPOX class probable F420-dependent enzyme
MPTLGDAEAWRRLVEARVAYLATVRADGRPHVVPIVFAVGDDRTVYSIADPKPKRGHDLVRHRNIAANPAVSLLVEHYDESWERLWWVRADGTARVAEEGVGRDTAIRLLRAKYAQYQTWTTPFGAATVIAVDRVSSWTLEEAG